jgi:hypothetical protein
VEFCKGYHSGKLQAPACPANIKLGWKLMAVTNTLVYFDMATITAVKRSYISATCGLYYKHIMIVNYDSNVINKLGASLSDDARVLICNRHTFIVQATGN